MATLERIATAYGAIIHAGIHRASSIRVAEAAKVIENTQRDINIALMNELAMILKDLPFRRARFSLQPGPSGTSCRSRPGWSADTVSVSIRTI